MKYYVIGNKNNTDGEYAFARLRVIQEGHIGIDPRDLKIKGFKKSELIQVQMKLLELCDGVVVLENTTDTYELSYAKALGKEIKYMSNDGDLKE